MGRFIASATAAQPSPDTELTLATDRGWQPPPPIVSRLPRARPRPPVRTNHACIPDCLGARVRDGGAVPRRILAGAHEPVSRLPWRERPVRNSGGSFARCPAGTLRADPTLPIPGE